ncbi:phage major capsid protein [Tomitella fengzijianii]|uniref:Phage major capsid protein n=1 Tax=Tomitella fengzijianii TaxID=2597660 RepID=A0A516X4I3_9ACTN|nr:phage major capsid protein [Tomitella fengzijianii]QDQ97976.1 phage major capsid protein [Tomitella fengzijianii]
MKLKEKRAAELAAARTVVDAAKAAARDLTADENTTIEEHLAEADRVKGLIDEQDRGTDLMRRLEGMAPESDAGTPGAKDTGDEPAAKSLGDHFVKHAHDRMVELKGYSGASAAAPEFVKTNTDTHVIGDWADGAPVLTDVDRTIVRDYREPLVVADLLGTGTISGNAISYFVEGALEGEFKNVAEAANKPQLHVKNPTSEVDALKKMAGFIDLSDEFVEDVPFLVTEINNRLLYELRAHEQRQLLHGNGTGSNIKGIFNRGIQTHAAADTAETAQADAIFQAGTKITTATGMSADGIVINPLDYQRFRLGKDGNGQYMGGGYFGGAYGNGGIMQTPPLWGLRTVVTPAVEQGTVLVGAFRQSATVYRKGGVRVESTNSDRDKFTSNIVTIRAEQRIALAVRQPLGFVKVDIAGDASGEA